MQPTMEDPLKKREQFAVSLRKEKKKQMISAKRQRLIQNSGRANQQCGGANESNQFMVTSDEGEVSMREQYNDPLNSRYNGYYKFADLNYLLSLLSEISPEFDIKGDPVSLIFNFPQKAEKAQANLFA